MNSGTTDGGRDGRPPRLLRAAIEAFVVLGLSLVTIFIIIPDQTTPGGALGLSPALLPTVCASAIAILAAAQFAIALARRGEAETEEAQPPVHYAALLIGATLAGLGAFRLAGPEAGCAVIAVAAYGALGERRPLRLALMAGGVAGAVALILWLGV